MPSFLTPIHEFNHCHDARGQFCTTTTVGITSQRPADDPGHKSNRDVFQTDMVEFTRQLRALPGVSNVTVQPAVGHWQGGHEASWSVKYSGNGAATRLLAATGQRYNQDAVLILKGCRGSQCQPAVELTFDHGVSGSVRDAVHDVLTSHTRANGESIIGGWTWLKRDGRTILRMVSVPQWGSTSAEHTATTQTISQQLAALGMTHTRHVQPVAVTVMERKGANSYAHYLH